LESFSGGVGTAALIAVCMGSAAGPAAATRFAILTGVVGLARSAAGAVSGHGVVALGYPGWFVASTLLSLPAFAVLHALAPPAPRAAPRTAAP
jgi:PAT family beta-lactamase induction signal transducer AmpG